MPHPEQLVSAEIRAAQGAVVAEIAMATLDLLAHHLQGLQDRAFKASLMTASDLLKVGSEELLFANRTQAAVVDVLAIAQVLNERLAIALSELRPLADGIQARDAQAMAAGNRQPPH